MATMRPVPAGAAKMKSFTLAATAITTLAISAFAVGISGPSDTQGYAVVIDGDTIKVGGKSIRLLGIDAPEMGQLCTPHDGSSPYDCGMKARIELRDLIGSRPVKCQLRGVDVYKRALGFCSVDGTDLGKFLISQGLAITYGDSSYRYLSDERMAKAERVGIWFTYHDEPANWRRSNVRH